MQLPISFTCEEIPNVWLKKTESRSIAKIAIVYNELKYMYY